MNPVQELADRREPSVLARVPAPVRAAPAHDSLQHPLPLLRGLVGEDHRPSAITAAGVRSAFVVPGAKHVLGDGEGQVRVRVTELALAVVDHGKDGLLEGFRVDAVFVHAPAGHLEGGEGVREYCNDLSLCGRNSIIIVKNNFQMRN